MLTPDSPLTQLQRYRLGSTEYKSLLRQALRAGAGDRIAYAMVNVNINRLCKPSYSNRYSLLTPTQLVDFKTFLDITIARMEAFDSDKDRAKFVYDNLYTGVSWFDNVMYFLFKKHNKKIHDFVNGICEPRHLKSNQSRAEYVPLREAIYITKIGTVADVYPNTVPNTQSTVINKVTDIAKLLHQDLVFWFIKPSSYIILPPKQFKDFVDNGIVPFNVLVHNTSRLVTLT